MSYLDEEVKKKYRQSALMPVQIEMHASHEAKINELDKRLTMAEAIVTVTEKLLEELIKLRESLEKPKSRFSRNTSKVRPLWLMDTQGSDNPWEYVLRLLVREPPTSPPGWPMPSQTMFPCWF